MNPFDYLNSINSTKKDIMEQESTYNPYMINRGLSYFNDTVLYANEMNRYHHLDNKLQYHFLINSIRPRKRFSKWLKKSDPDSVYVVKEYYGYSNEKARQALTLLTPEQITMIKKKAFKGGRK